MARFPSPQRLAQRATAETIALVSCLRSGLVEPLTPAQLVGVGQAVVRFGVLGGVVRASALRFGERVALIDELGSLTFQQLDVRSNAIANAWRERGLQAGDGVAVLARNHRGFLDAVFAATKCGARIVLFNNDFAGPQIREVMEREGIDLFVYDEEYTEELTGIEPRLGKWLAWTDTPQPHSLAALIDSSSWRLPPKPASQPKIIFLTSGTTGTPKGAPRPDPRSLTLMGGMFEKVPFRAREVTECCAPMFHALGFTEAMLAIALGSTLVLRRRFDPKRTLESMAEHHATTLIVVPVMLRRILDVDPEPRKTYDLSALRIVFVAGSQLGGPLCTRAMEALGPVVYNLYGSTEVAYATLATPEDLRSEPACVGSVVRGSVVQILGPDDKPVPTGETGRIFVGNFFQFEGYTGGGTKDTVGGLMSSGDVGHFDAAGRLFIDGRDDDMIVSGGENVFPAEIEETLAGHPDIVEVAAIGVADDEYGQRLRAFVVLRGGATLTEQDVKDHVKANLARFKVPRDVVFVDILPRNPTGKVLKRQLALQD